MLIYQFLMIRFIFFVQIGMMKMDGLIQMNQDREGVILEYFQINIQQIEWESENGKFYNSWSEMQQILKILP
ncbi:unnamed protein product [Paramecium primaurelia]|uniref:Uncharacterized protein n=1 Tax=Paramecium primaurelia TaxID=5886 RepID=A0A8S1N3T3_PARPR|nr:unnamed protein product [Paramecium primaurelia]